MGFFQPDYKNIVNAAKNIEPLRMPFYEHIICDEIMEKVLGKSFKELISGSFEDKKEYFRNYCDFFLKMGYDTVSFEQCITKALPGAGALYKHSEPVIKNRADFEKYPWEEISDRFFSSFTDDFKALREVMPEGMKGIGGPGNGLFEIVQDLCSYEGLCYISVDDPELFGMIFEKVSGVMKDIWDRFLHEFSDIYCVCRFGDDLGFKTQTLISAEDIRKHLIPRYREIIEIIHRFNKPFLMHSCGCIFSIMDDLINIAEIDAKHSNEDGIAPFKIWVDTYGGRIGNFGGVDTNVLCQLNPKDIEEYVKEVVEYSLGHGGFALGSGNSIPDYVPIEGYLAMIETGRKLRGE